MTRDIVLTFRLEWHRFWSNPLAYLLVFSRPAIWVLFLSAGLSMSVAHHTDLFMAVVAYCILFTGVTTAFSLCWERERGLLRLWFVYGMSARGYVIGKCIFSVVLMNLVLLGTLLCCVLSAPMGLGPVDWIAAIGSIFLAETLVALMGICVASFITRLDLFGPVVNFFMLPMLFTSGALHDIGRAGGLAGLVGAVNPFRYSLDLVRSCIMGSYPRNPSVIICLFLLSALLFIVASNSLKREV